MNTPFYQGAGSRLLKPVFRFIVNGTTNIRAVLIICCVFALISCTNSDAHGWKKNPLTGLVTWYDGIKPERSFLIMNDQIWHYNAVPLGESLELINTGVKGLVNKEGKSSIGCSLTISDNNGTVILKEEDLYKEKENFTQEEIGSLRCKISTGSPMTREELYQIKVVFWDKFGSGKIENSLTIRMVKG